MKKGLFTIVFMFLLTTVFTAAVAFVYEFSKERIEQNSQIETYKSILYAFGIFPSRKPEKSLGPTDTTYDIPWKKHEVFEMMSEHVKKVKIPVPEDQREHDKPESVTIYIKVGNNGVAEAYGFFLTGKGLWGTIEAFIAISSDLKKMVGIDFTKQVETPGLGARITEQEFKSFFRNLELSGFVSEGADKEPILMVKNKERSNLDESTNSFQAITGATQTSQGVLDMLNKKVGWYITVIKEFSKE